MGVIRTDQWLLKHYKTPLKITEKMEDYFEHAYADEIYAHLTQFGMYLPPLQKQRVRQLIKKQVWQTVEEDYQQLKRLWNGPSVPIFIFPSDTTNRKLKDDYNSKAGLTFKDKLFLFLSDTNTPNEIKALLTHEYNHACRLTNYSKEEADYTLLDTIILEGLAENAVRERLGEKYTAFYTSKYSDDMLNVFWEKHILPHNQLSKKSRKHHHILYGLHFYPSMMGYSVGNYLVKKYLEKHRATSQELLTLTSEKIAELDNVDIRG